MLASFSLIDDKYGDLKKFLSKVIVKKKKRGTKIVNNPQSHI